MTGSEIRPIEMTDAATTPVVAASSAPTKITALATPPRIGPNFWPMVSSKSSAMPERSRIRPMKVKKGMASSVSLAMMPNRRFGSACSSSGCNRPSSIPTRPKNKPLAARAKATGKPDSRKITSAPNMIGAMFEIRNCVIFFPGRSVQFVGGFERFDFFLWWRRLFFECAGVHFSHQVADALDQFGQSLQAQQEKAGRQQYLGRPLDQAAGIGRHFLATKRQQRVGNGEIQNQQRYRQQEQQEAEQVDPDLGAF